MPCDEENEPVARRQHMTDMFLQDGLDAFDDCEVLEFFLCYAVSDCNIAQKVRRMLDRYLTVGGVCDAPIDELTNVFALPENATLLLKLLPQMSRLYAESKMNVGSIWDSDELGLKFQTKFIGRTNEALALLLGDESGRVTYFEIISEGSLNSTDVPLRKIVDLSLRHRAKYVFIGHNHPSGSALPSESDIKTTGIIKSTLENIGVNLVDHYIITDADYVSLRQSGLAGKIIFTDDDK